MWGNLISPRQPPKGDPMWRQAQKYNFWLKFNSLSNTLGCRPPNPFNAEFWASKVSRGIVAIIIVSKGKTVSPTWALLLAFFCATRLSIIDSWILDSNFEWFFNKVDSQTSFTGSVYLPHSSDNYNFTFYVSIIVAWLLSFMNTMPQFSFARFFN